MGAPVVQSLLETDLYKFTMWQAFLHAHPSAEAVYRQAREIFPSISFDTVNRTLIQFMNIGLLQQAECSGQGRRYDPNTREHHHLKCLVCGSIMDIYNRDFDKIEIPEELRTEFKVEHKRVVLSGICKECQNKGKGGK